MSNFLCKLVIAKELILKTRQQNCYRNKNRENKWVIQTFECENSNEWWFISSFWQVWHRSLVILSFIGETGRGFGFASNLLTCPLVDSSTYHVTLSFIYPVYKQLVDLSTGWLVHFPCYSVFYLPCLQATGSLVYSLTCPLAYFSTKKLHNLAFSINFAIFANCLIHMYHMFVEIIDISYYEFKL